MEWLIIGPVLLILFIWWAMRSIDKEQMQPYTQVFITRIRIPATWLDWKDEPVNGVADFILGPGPCGLDVTSLDCGWYNEGKNFEVKQKCSNGESKTFTYRREDITGRVEVSRDEKVIDPSKES